MKFTVLLVTGLCLLGAKTASAADATPTEPKPQTTMAPPVEWVDPDTGHRVIRLSTEPGSSSLYFHQNAYTPEGDKLVFQTPGGIGMVDLASLGSKPVRVEIVVPGVRPIATARKTRDVYFTRGGQRGGGNNGVFAANLDTREIREIKNARGTTINCDETFSVMAVNAEDPTGKTPYPEARRTVSQMQRMFPGKKPEDLTPEQRYAAEKEDGLSRRVFNPTSMAFVFTNLKTGESATNGYQYAWLNHLQFSPIDPNLLLYCHEGTWHEVERVWTIRTDGSQQRLMHKRTMDMEIAGHEWWSFDGKKVWFDLQTPRSQDFWIAGVNIDTGKEAHYHIDRDSWGVHFNSSRDNQLFASDGGGASQVAYSTKGMWINLFRVQPDGTVAHERLANMSKHNYVTGRPGGVEPNCSITPDKKWVVFTGQFAPGQRHVYAVEIAKQ
jgi:oligogalacturonide lyase